MFFSQELGFSLSNADSLLAIHTGFNTDGDSLWYGSKSYSYLFTNVEFENRAVDITFRVYHKTLRIQVWLFLKIVLNANAMQ